MCLVIIDVLANDDPFFQNCSADSLTIDIISAPFSGSVVFYSIGNFQYTPDEGFSGEDSFAYEVCCGVVCDEATVSIVVNGGNDPPDAVDDEYATQVGEAVTIDILANDSDPNGDEIEVVFVGPPSNGAVELIADGVFVYVPDSTFVGVDSFIYIICDDGDPPLCDTATVYISVGLNNPPVIVDDNGVPVDTIYATTLANTPFEDCISVTDLDGDSITIDLLQEGLNGMTEFVNDSCFVFTPDSGFVGIDTLIFIACDNGVPPLCDTVVYIIDIVEEDLIPTANPDEVSTPINTPISIPILDNDVLEAGEPITIEIIDFPSNGEAIVDTLTNEIIYTPDSGFVGIDTLIYEVCDSNSCDTAIVLINVVGPLILELADDRYETEVGVPITFNVCDNDTLQGEYEVVFFSQTSSGSVDEVMPKGCQFVYTPGVAGEFCFEYVVENVAGLIDTAEVCIDVTDVCDSPIANTLTPNGDGINDVFALDRFVNCCSNPEVLIFNRWGGIVYDNKQPARGEYWLGEYHTNAGGNGEELPDGTYFYCILCQNPNNGEEVEKLTGFIHLDRR